MPTNNTLAATAAAFGLPVTAALPAPAKPARKAAKRKPSVAKVVVPATYGPGPTVYPKGRKTWTGYMVAVTLKASNPAAATKLHKSKAARAGYPASKPLDFKWLVLKGYIAPVA